MVTTDRKFFTAISLAFVAVTFIGFAPTYYLRGLSSQPALSPLVHLHGVLMSGWILLVAAQTGLVAMRRMDLHRSLGVAGFGLAVSMMVVSYLTALSAVHRGTLPLSFLIVPMGALIVPMGALIVFPVLIGAAFLLRRRGDYHKRLVFIATTELMNAAVDRLPGVAREWTPFYIGTDVFLLALVIYDLATLRRLHPATLWGGLFLVTLQVARVTLMNTSGWLATAKWLAS